MTCPTCEAKREAAMERHADFLALTITRWQAQSTRAAADPDIRDIILSYLLRTNLAVGGSSR